MPECGRPAQIKRRFRPTAASRTAAVFFNSTARTEVLARRQGLDCETEDGKDVFPVPTRRSKIMFALALGTDRPMKADRPSFATDDERWEAVERRDRAADGAFFYSVRTTGVYCRPSCAARLPRRENVSFHASPAAAEKAGFRPCRRCGPDQPLLAERQARLGGKACRPVGTAGEMPGPAAPAQKPR